MLCSWKHDNSFISKIILWMGLPISSFFITEMFIKQNVQYKMDKSGLHRYYIATLNSGAQGYGQDTHTPDTIRFSTK